MPRRAGYPIEHPGRNFQPAIGCPNREAAAENLTARLLDHFMKVDHGPRPGMPWIEKFACFSPVGVPSSRCTTTTTLIQGSKCARLASSSKPSNTPRCPVKRGQHQLLLVPYSTSGHFFASRHISRTAFSDDRKLGKERQNPRLRGFGISGKSVFGRRCFYQRFLPYLG